MFYVYFLDRIGGVDELNTVTLDLFRRGKLSITVWERFCSL